MIVIIPSAELCRLQFTAAESYPLECNGLLLGHMLQNRALVKVVLAQTVFMKRTKNEVVADGPDAFEELAARLFPGLDILGGWHTHPSERPTPSSADVGEVAEDDIEMILSVWPSHRKLFRFEQRAYLKKGDRLARAELRVV